MRPDPSFAYAQARIQARFSALPWEPEWQRLAAYRSLASFLEEARTGALRDWVKGFSGQSDAQDLEVGIRSQLWEILATVAGWVPTRWQAAVSWVGWLPLLPLLAHLRAGGAMPRWAARDAALRAFAGVAGELDIRGLEDVMAGWFLRSEEDLVAAWIAQWRSRWPRCSHEVRRDLESLVALLMAHVDAFWQESPGTAWRLRGELRERLRLQMHRCALQPTLPFVFLTLTALDLERLRAALITRALFAAQDAPAAVDTAGRAAA